MWRTLLLLGALTAIGCSRTHPDDLPAPDSPVQVEVLNNHPQSLEIFAAGGGGQQRLGLVHPGMRAQFVVPRPLLGTGGVEFIARPTAAGAPYYKSGPLLLSPGAVVDLVLAVQLFSSTATIRP